MMYENILGKVQKLLAQDKEEYYQERSADAQEDISNIQEQQSYQPPSSAAAGITGQRTVQPAAHPPHPPSTRQEGMIVQPSSADTLDRLRQLGVSFISPSDLVPAPTPAPPNPYNSFFLPQATLPSTTIINPSPDTSLAINNLALKYLSDAELARLAGHHQHHQHASKAPPGQAGRQAEYSLASHQFLARYGLGGDPGQGGHGGTGEAHGQRQHPPPALPARPPHPAMPAPAVSVEDRVLDITAIRNLSTLG